MRIPLRVSVGVLLVLLGISVCASCAAGQAIRNAGTHESARTDFDDGDAAFQSSPHLPPQVLKALVSSEEVGYLRDLLREKPGTNLNQYFRYRIIQLSENNETDYLVNGVPPVSGADCGWFWIVISEQNRARVVLFDATESISILETSTQGHRDIETVWGSASGESIDHIFRYDGHAYRLAKSSDVEGKDAP